MDWQFAYDAYPVNDDMIWLNNCGTVPAGKHVLSAVASYLKGYSKSGHLTDVAPRADVQKGIKTILAQLLNCETDSLAIIHHTAEGMNFISHGLKLTPGDEIILLENEYPSNVYPWWHWQEKGVKLMTAPMADTPEEFLENLKACINAHTKVMALSAVHWCTGMPLPINAIGKLCKDNDIIFVLDGAQGVGTQPIDVETANIYAMAFSAWKWLMGPLGLGVLYLAPEAIESLSPIFLGSSSVPNEQEYLPYKTTLKNGADRFVASTPNYTDWVYFLSALEFLNNIGFETVQNRLFELSRHLQNGLAEIGFEVLSNNFSDHPSAIVVSHKPQTATKALMTQLNRHNIVAADRLGRLRMAAHIYNSPQQLDQVIEILAKI
jgi:cysteine desulfurase / selenocysteine lyase